VKGIYGLDLDPYSVQCAVNNLRALGIADREILVLSSEPFEEFEFSDRDKANWLRWIAGAGGVLGLISAYALTSLTQRAWPLKTGGMPIVAIWPNTIIMFELTMLFAILATVIALFVTAKLSRQRSPIYDSEISKGYILVGVEHPPEPLAARVESALAVEGAGQVKIVA
jgi:Alternative complex III, ActD subunit